MVNTPYCLAISSSLDRDAGLYIFIPDAPCTSGSKIKAQMSSFSTREVNLETTESKFSILGSGMKSTSNIKCSNGSLKPPRAVTHILPKVSP